MFVKEYLLDYLQLSNRQGIYNKVLDKITTLMCLLRYPKYNVKQDNKISLKVTTIRYQIRY